jgi:hypothetical protein
VKKVRIAGAYVPSDGYVRTLTAREAITPIGMSVSSFASGRQRTEVPGIAAFPVRFADLVKLCCLEQFGDGAHLNSRETHPSSCKMRSALRN